VWQKYTKAKTATLPFTIFRATAELSIDTIENIVVWRSTNRWFRLVNAALLPAIN
jgi:hypothetical protein